MYLKSLSLFMLLILLSSEHLIGGYTTPNTGVNWTLDSLVAYSSGTLVGSFPNYTLNDTLSIAQNDRLTLRAGSVISVAQGTGKGFTVFGILRATGTVTDTIVVRGVVSTAGSHRGFRFDDTSVDSLCTIAYCRIQDAVDAVYCFNANTRITNTLFTNNSSNGVRCYGASPTISYCTFIENRQSAITANVGSSPIIEHNVFARNNSQNTSARNQIAIGGQGANNPIIRDNEIYNQSYFRAGGISLLTLGASDVCNAIVENNYIHDNSFGIVIQGLSTGGTLHPIIRYNRIEDNRINPDPLVSGSGITVQTGGPTNAPILTGNFLKGNYWGITIVSASGLSSSPKPAIGDLSNTDTSDDGWNIFINNNNGGRIYQLYNNGTQDISAQNNYWGSSDSVTVESWITHRPDSAVFGFVNYRPYGIRGLGRPDTFWIQRIVGTEQPTYRLHWRFSVQDSTAKIRVLFALDSLYLSQLALLADTVTSYLYHTPFPIQHFVGLSTFNRFGESDTVAQRYDPPTEVRRTDVAEQFSLNQNYPNPFNPSTIIQYSLPTKANVSLKVYDILGREIATLVDDKLQRGTYEVQWDASSFAGGVYFYRLMTGRFVETKKLLLTK
jgi:hypothetical protein